MGGKESIVGQVQKLVLPMAEKEDVVLWDVVFEKEGGSWFLRVFLDQGKVPVTIDICEKISRALSKELDLLDPIPQSYYLEVSSAGLGRKLTSEKHFLSSIGKEVTAKLYQAKEGEKEWQGILTRYEKGVFTLQREGGEMEIAQKECAYVKLNDDLDLF